MPILKVRALPQKDSSLIPIAIKQTTQAIAEHCKCQPSNVWIIWEELKPNSYFEGAQPAQEQPDNTHPPLAELTCFEGLSPAAIEELLAITAKTLCESLKLKNNIFISYHEVKSGQVIAGDSVVRKN